MEGKQRRFVSACRWIRRWKVRFVVVCVVVFLSQAKKRGHKSTRTKTALREEGKDVRETGMVEVNLFMQRCHTTSLAIKATWEQHKISHWATHTCTGLKCHFVVTHFAARSDNLLMLHEWLALCPDGRGFIFAILSAISRRRSPIQSAFFTFSSSPPPTAKILLSEEFIRLHFVDI